MVHRKPTGTARAQAATHRRSGPWTRALVTCGSAGIGEAFARALAVDGTELILVARRPEPLTRLADEPGAQHRMEVEVLPADLTDAADLARIETRLEADQRPIDPLVNNAGSETEHRRFVERDRELLAAEVELNVLALMRLTHAGIGAMLSRGRGRVINVSAGNALFPTPGSCSYGASKAFVNSFTEALAYELCDSGVSLTAVCPGFTRTGAQDRLGLNRKGFPGFVWREADEVAHMALRAATRGKVVSWLGFSGAYAALVGRHLPHRLLIPQVARARPGSQMIEHIAGSARPCPRPHPCRTVMGVVARSSVRGAAKGFMPSRSRLRGERGSPSKRPRGALMVCTGEPREVRPAQSRATDDSPTECP